MGKKNQVNEKTKPHLFPRVPAEDPIQFVTCEHCGNEQADMGKNVLCEQCGEAIS